MLKAKNYSYTNANALKPPNTLVQMISLLAKCMGAWGHGGRGTYGLFGNLENEEIEGSRGEESRGEWFPSTLFGSFLRKEGEEFGGIWRGFNHL